MNGMVIYKYPIDVVGKQTLRIPYPYKFLSFQSQGDGLCAWFAVNRNPSSDDYRDIELMIIGTGHMINSGDDGYSKFPEHLGTAQLSGFVWHLFHNKTACEALNEP